MAKRYRPNHVARPIRIVNIILALVLLGYGAYGLINNDFSLFGRLGRFHLHDGPALLMFSACVCGALVLLSVVVDHYDGRNTERHYRRFATIGTVVGWSLFAASLSWYVAQQIMR